MELQGHHCFEREKEGLDSVATHLESAAGGHHLDAGRCKGVVSRESKDAPVPVVHELSMSCVPAVVDTRRNRLTRRQQMGSLQGHG